MENELEVQQAQQLSAQRSLNDLTDQLTLADHLVYKKYLTELQNYGMVELSQKMLEVQDPAQCIRMFQLKKLTLKKGEDMFQKLSTVYYSSMAQGCSLAVMIDVPEGNAGANIYLGVREDPLKQSMKSRKLEISSKALQKVLLSNFPGSDIKGISPEAGKNCWKKPLAKSRRRWPQCPVWQLCAISPKRKIKPLCRALSALWMRWKEKSILRCFWQNLFPMKRRRLSAAGMKICTALFRPSARVHGLIPRTRAQL